MILRVIPHVGGILRGEAATDSGARARSSGEELTPADDQAAVAAALATLRSRDGGFDLVATTRGVVGAREVVDLARQAGDASAARQVMSDGLWRVFVLLLAERAAHGVRRQGTSVVVGAEVVAATRDRLAEQLRIRLACQGERCEVADVVLRGQYGQQKWDEDWIIRRSADATTPASGGVLSGGAVHRAGRAGSAADTATAISGLQSVDPSFDVTAFLDSARVAVGAYAIAHSAQDDRLLRRITTPGYWQTPNGKAVAAAIAEWRRYAGDRPGATNRGRMVLDISWRQPEVTRREGDGGADEMAGARGSARSVKMICFCP